MHNYLAGQKRTKLRNAALAGGRFLVSFKRALGVSVFNGSVVYFNVGIGLIFLGGSCSTRQELYFTYFEENNWPLNAVGVLSPEVNMKSSHNTKTTSIRRWGIAREGGA